MLNGAWSQIYQIKIHQLPKFSNSPKFSPSKFTRYTVCNMQMKTPKAFSISESGLSILGIHHTIEVSIISVNRSLCKNNAI